MSRVAAPWRIAAGTALMILAWVLLMPPGAGPDEPAHVVRSAGLASGQYRGDPPLVDVGSRSFEVPGWVTEVDPSCYAFNSFTPASCRPRDVDVDSDVALDSTSWGYPIWGHLLPGAGSLLGGPTAMRLAAALIPAVLVIVSITVLCSRSRLAAAAALLACTPQVWSTMSQVNPSGLAIAGGLATTVAWLAPSPGRTERLLLIGGLLAVLLPRRDGPVWACALVGTLLVFDSLPVRERVARLGQGGGAAIGLAGVAAAGYALTTPGEVAVTALASPLFIAAALAIRWCWQRSTGWRLGSVVVGAGALSAASVVAVDRRTVGVDDGVARIIIGETSTNLLGTISELSWLDVDVPRSFVFAWFVALGALAGVALLGNRLRPLVAAGAVVAVGIVLSWLIELTQNFDGVYFQGRYYLPLMIAVPLLVGHAIDNPPAGQRLVVVIVAISVAVSNAAVFAAGRRWGVGEAGPLNPRAWDTYGTVLPPSVLFVVHLAGSLLLASAVVQRSEPLGSTR